MNPHLAEEHLQTIRLLMERSALYRRALAPIMLVAGGLGTLAAAVGLWFHVEGGNAFAELWLGTACVVVTLSFLLARRQAFNDHEKFWSPPTFRVAQALLPPLLAGLVLSLSQVWIHDNMVKFQTFDPKVITLNTNLEMVFGWLLLYGCALHSAGFFMSRGIKWFGWGFVITSILLMSVVEAVATGHVVPDIAWPRDLANWLMGLTFGCLHLAYGIYLWFTEKKHPVA